MAFPYNERVNGRYGAPMGRPGVGASLEPCERVTVRRVPLTEGYDGGGAYWGDRPRGVSLFCAWTPDRTFVRFVDAPTAADAIKIVREA